MASQRRIPSTPKVISPSPSLDTADRDDYFAPQTRSKTASIRKSTTKANATDNAKASPARGRKKSTQLKAQAVGPDLEDDATSDSSKSVLNGKPNGVEHGTAAPDGLLSPASATFQGLGSSYWRNLSRSRSPIGLIPIHREWRDFVHKHEVPRKALHVSIGFLTLWLYYRGVQTSQIHPVLLSLLIPIFSTDVIRFRWPALNSVYIRVLGPFMRESEAHDRYNGVISYLAGLWATMYFCDKDVAVMSVLLLSWSDTAASTIGRAYGKYTPRIRKGKSLAGSLAAFAVGVSSAVLFWKVVAATSPKALQVDFKFQGTLTLPRPARELLGYTTAQSSVSGPLALAILAFVSGIVASVSEAVDIFGLDDNLTIPILSGLGLSAFLWAFVA